MQRLRRSQQLHVCRLRQILHWRRRPLCRHHAPRGASSWSPTKPAVRASTPRRNGEVMGGGGPGACQPNWLPRSGIVLSRGKILPTMQGARTEGPLPAEIQFSMPHMVQRPRCKQWHRHWVCRHWNYCRCCLMANDLPSSSLQGVALTAQRPSRIMGSSSCFYGRQFSVRCRFLYVGRTMHCCMKLYARAVLRAPERPTSAPPAGQQLF